MNQHVEYETAEKFHPCRKVIQMPRLVYAAELRFRGYVSNAKTNFPPAPPSASYPNPVRNSSSHVAKLRSFLYAIKNAVSQARRQLTYLQLIT